MAVNSEEIFAQHFAKGETKGDHGTGWKFDRRGVDPVGNQERLAGNLEAPVSRKTRRPAAGNIKN